MLLCLLSPAFPRFDATKIAPLPLRRRRCRCRRRRCRHCRGLDEDGEININLQKVAKGQTWGAALRGREGRGGLQAAEVDPITRQNMQKQILLERFQEEVSQYQPDSCNCLSMMWN
ncbi:unnamed protein product [Phaeothamnion confervicola]